MNKVKISSYYVKKVKDFAQKRIHGSKGLYTYRGIASAEKMEEDIIIGTMAELGIYQYLKSHNLSCTKPDFKIYENRRKSFNADLLCDGLHIHVKSQGLQSVERYGKSFLFQRSDKLYKKPNDQEWIAMATVDLKAKEVDVLGFVRSDKISWDECKVPFFRRTKVAIYVDEMDKRLIKTIPRSK